MRKSLSRHIKLVFTLLALILLTGNSFAQDNQKEGKKRFSFSRSSKKSLDNKQDKRKIIHYDKDSTGIISFDKLFFDYGDIVQTQEAKAVFEITNLGGGMLVIDSVDVSCDCVEIELESKEIIPGGTTKLIVRYNTNLVGEIKKSITVVSNDTKRNRITLLLTGNVVLKK
jgi:hypothetical protein